MSSALEELGSRYLTLRLYSGKNVAANYVKQDSQGWFSRRSSQQEWDHEREIKRRRLMGSEEELQELYDKLPEGSTSKLQLNVLKSAPEGAVQPPVERTEVSAWRLAAEISADL